MPAAKLRPVSPSTTTTPPVMYSQPWSPQPSTTATAPELRTAKRSPATPWKYASPAIAPYSTVLPTMMFSVGSRLHRRLAHDDAAAGQALADIVVGIAGQLQRHAARQERAEAAAGVAAQADRDRVFRQPGMAVALRHLARQHRADGAVHVADVARDAHRLAALRAPAAPARSARCPSPCRGDGPASRNCRSQRPARGGA